MLDLPSALFITASRIPDGVIVGKFRTSREYFVIAFEKGSPLVQCVNLALQEMKDDGTLDEIRRKWLPDATDVPVIDG